MDVVRERFQRRHIDDLSLVRQPTIKPLAYEAIDGTEKGGQGLARTSRCRDQHIASRGNGGPRVILSGRRRGEALVKPRANRGMKNVKCHGKVAEFERFGYGFSL